MLTIVEHALAGALGVGIGCVVDKTQLARLMLSKSIVKQIVKSGLFSTTLIGNVVTFLQILVHKSFHNHARRIEMEPQHWRSPPRSDMNAFCQIAASCRNCRLPMRVEGDVRVDVATIGLRSALEKRNPDLLSQFRDSKNESGELIRRQSRRERKLSSNCYATSQSRCHQKFALIQPANAYFETSIDYCRSQSADHILATMMWSATFPKVRSHLGSKSGHGCLTDPNRKLSWAPSRRSKIACDTNGIHGDPTMWLFHCSMKNAPAVPSDLEHALRAHGCSLKKGIWPHTFRRSTIFSIRTQLRM